MLKKLRHDFINYLDIAMVSVNLYKLAYKKTTLKIVLLNCGLGKDFLRKCTPDCKKITASQQRKSVLIFIGKGLMPKQNFNIWPLMRKLTH